MHSRALYSRVLARMKDVELAEKDKGNNVRMVDPAVAPARPIYSLRSPALVLAGVGLLLGSFGSAVLRRLKVMAEREELAGLPPADA